MGANQGTDYGQDFTLKPGAACLTTTSQYCWVGGGTGSTEFTPNLINTTTSYIYPVGINQTRLTAGSLAMAVRVSGASKVVCGGSVTAMRWLKCASAGSVVMLTAAAAVTMGSNTIACGAILGQSLENGQSLQVIEMIVNPAPISIVGALGWS